MALKYPPKEKQGTRKEPEDNSLMQQAQKENFSIYVLRGMLAHMHIVRANKAATAVHCQMIEQDIKAAIEYIKSKQEIRMEAKKKARKK